jgi:hypothetical protein
MACDITLGDVTYSCEDLGIGGLKRVIIANKSTLVSTIKAADGTTDIVAPVSVSGAGAVTILTDPSVTVGDDSLYTLLSNTVATYGGNLASEVQFNLKDGFSVFSEVKTVTADGIVSSVPTIAIEIPKMSEAHRNDLNNLAKPGAELVAFIETAAGTYHMVGWEYGLYASTVDGTSGTGRSEKNRYQLTLTGEEDSLSYSIDSVNWVNLTSSVA